MMVDEARQFAEQAHGDQLYGTKPYIDHLQAVVDVLMEYNFDGDLPLLAAGYLHDVVEDTAVSLTEIETRFGTEIASLVYGVTNEPGTNRKERAAATYPKIRQDARRVALKLADRIANARNTKENSPGLFKMYRKEYDAFRSALQRGHEFGGMWGELDYLFK